MVAQEGRDAEIVDTVSMEHPDGLAALSGFLGFLCPFMSVFTWSDGMFLLVSFFLFLVALAIVKGFRVGWQELG